VQQVDAAAVAVPAPDRKLHPLHRCRPAFLTVWQLLARQQPCRVVLLLQLLLCQLLSSRGQVYHGMVATATWWEQHRPVVLLLGSCLLHVSSAPAAPGLCLWTCGVRVCSKQQAADGVATWQGARSRPKSRSGLDSSGMQQIHADHCYMNVKGVHYQLGGCGTWGHQHLGCMASDNVEYERSMAVVSSSNMLPTRCG
jgi:hypothetical protein